MNKQKFYGWKMIVVLWLQYFLNMGLPLYGGAVISSVMLANGVMTRSVHGVAFTLLNLCIGLASVLIAVSIAKRGVRTTFIIGSVLIMIGAFFLGTFATSSWHFFLALGVIIGTGIGFGSVMPLSTAVARWFTRMRGKAMAVALTAPSVAGLVFAPIMNYLIQNTGLSWRGAWLFMAGAMIISITTAFLFIKESPAVLGQEPDGGNSEQSQGSTPINSLRTNYEWTTKQAHKTGAFFLILIAACVTQFPFFFITAHWIPAMRGFGFSPAAAAFLMSVFTIMGLPARLVAGHLLDRIQAKFVFMGGFVCYIIANIFALLITPALLPLAYLATIFMAFGFGMSFVSLQAITVQYFGLKAYPKLNGTNLLVSAIVSCPGPMIAGILFTRFNGYAPSFIMNITICVIGFVVVLFLKIPKSPSVSENQNINKVATNAKEKHNAY